MEIHYEVLTTILTLTSSLLDIVV